MFDNLICIEAALLEGQDETIRTSVFCDAIVRNNSHFQAMRYIPIIASERRSIYPPLAIVGMSKISYEIDNSEAIINHTTISAYANTEVNGCSAKLYAIKNHIEWNTKIKKIKCFTSIFPFNKDQKLLVTIKWNNILFEYVANSFPFSNKYESISDIQPFEKLDILINRYKQECFCQKDFSQYSYSELAIRALCYNYLHNCEGTSLESVEIFRPTIAVYPDDDRAFLRTSHSISDDHVLSDLHIYVSDSNKCLQFNSSNLVESSYFAKNDVYHEKYEDIYMRIYFSSRFEFNRMLSRIQNFGKMEERLTCLPSLECLPTIPFSKEFQLKEEKSWGTELGIHFIALYHHARN